MNVDEKLFMISMPRTGSTWAVNVMHNIPGFMPNGKRHKMNTHFSRLSVPQLSFFRDPTQWYISMYYYYKERKAGDIYACINSPLRIKYIYSRENSPVWQGSKLFVLSQIFASINGPMHPEMSFKNFMEEINSKRTMALLGYGMLREKKGLTLYQAMFFDAVSRNKEIICSQSLLEEVYSLTASERLILIELNSKSFTKKFFTCMNMLGFAEDDLEKAKAKANLANRNSNDSTKYSKDLKIFSSSTFSEADYNFYSKLKKLSF